ncbi:MAG: sulfur carrier protein ThiS [Acidobacteriota bacterium]
MKVTVNSEVVDMPAGTTLEAWLSVSDYAQRPCAVAVNETFVPRQSRADTVLREGDRIDVLEAFQGG